MQRILISTFRPLFRDGGGLTSMTPVVMASRTFKPSPQVKQQEVSGSGKLTPKMAKLQQKFQVDNDKPIFLKGGPMDSILYKLTLVLCAIGTVGDLYLFFGYILA